MKGLIFVLSGPSGVGKTSVAVEVLQEMPELRRSVSLNTRPRRPEEVEGKDYCFVSKEEFERQKAAGKLVEAAEVYGFWRGTSSEQLLANHEQGVHTLCVIDWNGLQALRKLFSDVVVGIFLLPPSLEILKQRLQKRGDAPEEIERRFSKAQGELPNALLYEYSVAVHNVEQGAEVVRGILRSELHRTSRWQPLESLGLTNLSSVSAR